MECVFCKIIEGSEDKELIRESEFCMTILSNPSQIRGHCLVIPKRHVEKLSELNKEELNDLINEVVNIEEIILKKFSGCDIKQNYRPFLEESKFKVSHLHFHIQPRELDDELFKINNPDFKDLNKEELREIKMEIFENG